VGCPICDRHQYIEQTNIFGNVYPNLVKFFKNQSEPFLHSIHSHGLAELVCPLCHTEVIMKYADLAENGFKCPKCENITYPNKMLRALLDNLPNITDLKYEKTF